MVVPNAGMPENEGGQAVYKMTPKNMADALSSFLDDYSQIKIIGGCCGTSPLHITELRKVIDEKKKE